MKRTIHTIIFPITLACLLAACGPKKETAPTAAPEGANAPQAHAPQAAPVQIPTTATIDDLKAQAANGDSKAKSAMALLDEAAKGKVNAQYSVGAMYWDGFVIKKDYSKALEWFNKSAAQGHHGAEYFLGIMHENGQGTPRDVNKAVEWYKKAAAGGEQYSREALKRLGK